MDNMITLLNDGETFTSTKGTAVYIVSDENLEKLGDCTEWHYIECYDLTNPAHLRMLADRLEKSH